MKKLLLSILSFSLITTTVFAGKGHHLSYKINVTSTDQGVGGNIDFYFDAAGDNRSVIDVKVPQIPGGGIKMTTLVKMSEPQTVYMIDDANKTYSIVTVDPEKAATDAKYDIKVLGKETVNGYDATHVQITNEGHVSDMWLSKNVPGYTAAISIKGNKYISYEQYIKPLKEKGVEGLPVKLKGEAEGHSFEMNLTAAKAEELKDGLFQVPAGYTQNDGPDAMLKQMGLPSVQEMMNMTPEEREKMAEEMQQKFGK